MAIQTKTLGIYTLTMVIGAIFSTLIYLSGKNTENAIDSLLNINIPLRESTVSLQQALAGNELGLRERPEGTLRELAGIVAQLRTDLPATPEVAEIDRHVQAIRHLKRSLLFRQGDRNATQGLLVQVAEHRNEAASLLEDIQQHLRSEAHGISGSISHSAAKTRSLTLLFSALIAACAVPVALFFSRSIAHAEEQVLLSRCDPLTALPNRRQFEDTADQLARSEDTQVLGLIKLDHFHRVTAGYGYAVGDVIIRKAAKRLQALLSGRAHLFRFEGASFGFALPFEGHQQWLARLCEAFEQPLVVDGVGFYMTVSIGYCVSPDDGGSGQCLIKNADASLTWIRNHGGNKCLRYTRKLEKVEQSWMTINNELRQALTNNELLLHYQPQITTSDGTLVGMEALLRWQSPVRGMVSPRDFIPLAEQSDLIVDIGAWVIRTACQQIGRWQQCGNRCVVAVNVSPRQFLHFNFLTTVTTILRETRIDPALLEFEITENVMMENVEYCIGIMHQLKKLGVRLSIDDFGTGFSSMNYLKRFSIDKLKIDQSFVQDLATNSRDRAIVQTVIDLCHNLGLTAIAEGVETEAQRALLCSYGCDELQGYLIGHPWPAGNLSEYFLDQGTSVVRQHEA